MHSAPLPSFSTRLVFTSIRISTHRSPWHSLLPARRSTIRAQRAFSVRPGFKLHRRRGVTRVAPTAWRATGCAALRQCGCGPLSSRSLGAPRAALSYLGTYSDDRQAALEALFIEPARRWPHAHFVIGGAQYPNHFPWNQNILFWRHVASSDHPRFYASARCTFNVTRRAMAAFGWCPSGRLFEAAACGTPILSD